MKRFVRVCLALVTAGLAVAGVDGSASAQARGAAGSTGTALVAPLNLNTATAEQLDRLPGIGPKMAAAILDRRQKMGGFRKVEDLMSVRGIGEKTFIKLRPLVTVAPKPGSSQ